MGVDDGWGRLVPTDVMSLQCQCCAEPRAGAAPRGESFPLCKAQEEMQQGKKLPFPGHIIGVSATDGWRPGQQLTALVPLSFGASPSSRVKWQGFL